MTLLSERISREILYDLLVTNQMSYTQASKVLGCSYKSVQRIADMHDITPSRPTPVDIDFFRVPSSNLFYILGLLATDGYVGDEGRIGIELIDEDVIKWVANTIGFTRRPSRRVRGSLQPTFTLRFTSKDVAEILADYGIVPRKSLNLAIKNIPKEYEKDFLRGVFEGDGCVSFTRRQERKNSVRVLFSIVSSSPTFIKQIEEMIIYNCEVQPSILTSLSGREVALHVLSVRRIGDITKIAQTLYPPGVFGMGRKLMKLRAIEEHYSKQAA